ncbi:MAG: DNA-processing protein DprA [Oscillospiraceae bacterium]|nr:DNA-processing protein DprA [Oscillospiraceae bacterium]MBR3952254.1 DNA-processing protein DprA [Oscillospiraceae bacterium]
MSLEHWAWLGIAAQPGSRIVDDILRVFPDPEEFFLSGDSGIEKVGIISGADALRIRATSLDVAKKAVETAYNYGAKVITKESEFYPKGLLSIETAPPVLYVLGDETCLNMEPAIGIVGTRRMSEYGNSMAKIIAGGLGSAGALVVSGMALGIDSAAHKACLSAGGKTVAVQGCGICKTFPEENIELKELIAANGAVISEFVPDAEPRSSFFPIRNRIVSGMSLGVCVIEAAARSGTSITANLAFKQGRKVFAVPADVNRPTSQGTFRLLRSGAIPVAGAKDILMEFGDEYTSHLSLDKILSPKAEKTSQKSERTEKPAKPIKKAPPAGLSKNASEIYRVLDRTPRSADEISDLTNLPSSAVAVGLTELELMGLISPVSGRRFVIA